MKKNGFTIVELVIVIAVLDNPVSVCYNEPKL